MLRLVFSLFCRVLAWRSILLLLCLSQVAPWGVLGAAVVQQQAAGGAQQGLPAKDNVYNDNINFNMNQKISNNANNPVIYNKHNNNNNNNVQNSNNNNDNLRVNENPKPNQPFPAMGFNDGVNNVASMNNDKKVKFPPAGSPAGNAAAGSERLWPAPEKKPYEWQQGKAVAKPAAAMGDSAAAATGAGQQKVLANPPAPEKLNLGLGPPPPPAGGAGGNVAPEGENGFQRFGEDTRAIKKRQESDTLFYQKPSDDFNQGTNKPMWRPRATPPVPGRYAVAGARPATDSKLFHPTVAYTLFNASYVKNDENNRLGLDLQQDNRANGFQDRPLSHRRRRKFRKPGVTAPPSKPKMDMKEHVSWFEGSRMYAFRASPDTRLLIRHAPIPAAGSPWPLPQHYYPEDVVFSLRPEHFQFHAIGETCDVLDFQFDRIRRNTFGDDWEKTVEEAAAAAGGGGGAGGWGEQEDYKYKEIRYVNVTVLKECPKYPQLNDDESYDLEVKRSGASIIAREVWGAVRALETFSQLIYQDDEGRYLINRTLINDFPRFPHRGILLDTARHYLNKETVINNLEAMAQNKMNVFHWHITDDQSFPFESKTYPNLTKNGAYDSRTHIYTHEVIAEIIEEARLRGIRVIPEFDTPGHTLSWGFGQDYLLTPCYDYNRQPNGLFGPINPILKTTYQFLQKFFREVLAVFKDKYIHLGGDEVPFDCWESNPQIRNFINRNNLSDIRDVLGLYERKLLEIVAQLGKNRDKGSGYIVWQEVVDNGVNVKADTIVQVWMGDAFDVERMINMGLRVIYSTCWYLDYINYGQDWDKYYRCEQLDQLQDFQLKNSSLLLGGEAALWTEYADDENVISRLWPRASAAAERLWSNKRVRDEVAAASRIEEQRCRMLRRGLKVGVLSGPGHCPVWSHRGKQQQKKEAPIFSWSSHNDEMQFKSNYPQVYVVDMNAMYLVPVLIVICICCLTLITLAQDSKSKIVAILSYPVAGSSKKGVKGLLYIFMAFAFAWCIWTAPIWMNSWETGANKARPVAPSH